MKCPEHVTLSFLIAQLGVQQQYGVGGTLLVIAAGNLPDLDALTLFVSWRIYRTYHRIVGHGLLVTLLGPPLLALLGSHGLGLGPFLPLWGWLQVALLVHLLTDVLFYRWPVQLLWPFSARGWGAGLVSWNDLVPTLVLYTTSLLALCWRERAFEFGLAGVIGFGLYLLWRAWMPRPQSGWAYWLTGGWAPESPRFWKWLTGDFIT
jgi:membrane-bound metal-dependent hydrolase YbcI (DUF457 family)